MDRNQRCPHCGANPNQCVSACYQAAEDAKRNQELDQLETILEEAELEPWVVMLEFQGDLDTQRVLLNRLRAQWRGAMRVVEADPEYGTPYMACVARKPEHLGGVIQCTYNVSMKGIQRSHSHDEFFRVLGNLIEEGWVPAK